MNADLEEMNEKVQQVWAEVGRPLVRGVPLGAPNEAKLMILNTIKAILLKPNGKALLEANGLPSDEAAARNQLGLPAAGGRRKKRATKKQKRKAKKTRKH